MKEKGQLIIIGGAEDKTGESRILKEVVKMASKREGNFLIMTTPTEKPEEVGEEYREVFSRLGMDDTDVLNVKTRDEANSSQCVEKVRRASGIFFTGGDQLRITSILGGTRVEEALREAKQEGAGIVGTSAGASVMSSTMIVEGESHDPARKCTLKMAPGLGFLEEVIIDQHFDQRGRFGRLLCGVAENPNSLGIGIDEDTAICVEPEGRFRVIGSNAVTVIDGKTIKSSNVSELKPNEILSIINVTLHVLPEGYGFDLSRREVLRLH